MIEFLQMAEFMHDEVILHGSGEIDDLVVDADILPAGAAPPPGFLMTDRNPVQSKTIVSIVLRNSFRYQNTGFFFASKIIPSRIFFRCLRSNALERVEFLPNPIAFIEEKLFDRAPTEPPGGRHHHPTVTVNSETQMLGAFTFAKCIGFHQLPFHNSLQERQRLPPHLFEHGIVFFFDIDVDEKFRSAIFFIEGIVFKRRRPLFRCFAFGIFDAI